MKEDYTSRLAKTLVWLRTKAVKENKPQVVQYINRFINSVEPENGEYTKHYKAIALVDRDFLDEELAKELEVVDMDNFKIIVLAFDGLRELYESVYDEILEASDDGNPSNA